MILREDIYEKVKKQTSEDYGAVKFNDYEVAIREEYVGEMIEDLLYEIGRLEEQIEDIIQDRNDNWKPISIEEQVE